MHATIAQRFCLVGGGGGSSLIVGTTRPRREGEERARLGPAAPRGGVHLKLLCGPIFSPLLGRGFFQARTGRMRLAPLSPKEHERIRESLATRRIRARDAFLRSTHRRRRAPFSCRCFSQGSIEFDGAAFSRSRSRVRVQPVSICLPTLGDAPFCTCTETSPLKFLGGIPIAMLRLARPARSALKNVVAAFVGTGANTAPGP